MDSIIYLIWCYIFTWSWKMLLIHSQTLETWLKLTKRGRMYKNCNLNRLSNKCQRKIMDKKHMHLWRAHCDIIGGGDLCNTQQIERVTSRKRDTSAPSQVNVTCGIAPMRTAKSSLSPFIVFMIFNTDGREWNCWGVWVEWGCKKVKIWWCEIKKYINENQQKYCQCSKWEYYGMKVKPIPVILIFAFYFNLLKTSPEYTRAGVYGKCMLQQIKLSSTG